MKFGKKQGYLAWRNNGECSSIGPEFLLGESSFAYGLLCYGEDVSCSDGFLEKQHRRGYETNYNKNIQSEGRRRFRRVSEVSGYQNGSKSTGTKATPVPKTW